MLLFFKFIITKVRFATIHPMLVLAEALGQFMKDLFWNFDIIIKWPFGYVSQIYSQSKVTKCIFLATLVLAQAEHASSSSC